MKKLLIIFKYLAYLNLVFLILALYYMYKPIIWETEKDLAFESFSTGLILMGFGLSLVSLRDMSKIDKMGRFIIEKPRVFKTICFISLTLALIAMGFGMSLFFTKPDLYDFSIGLLSFGLGYLALVKSLIDQARMLTNHYE